MDAARSCPRILLPVGLVLLAVATGCMVSPLHGDQVATMGAPVTLWAWGAPNSVITFEHAVYERTGTTYTVATWKRLGSCQTTGQIVTDGVGVQWQGCLIVTPLPNTDCTYGGRGAWHAAQNNPGTSTRYARVRGTANGFPLSAFPVGLDGNAITNSFNTAGGLATILTYSNGQVDAEIHANTPTVGTAGLGGSADLTAIAVVGDHAYAGRATGTGNEFLILDVSNAGAPALLGSTSIGATVNAVAVEGDYAYLATTADDGELVLVDIRTPTAPTVARREPLDGPEDALSIGVVGGTIVVGRASRSGPEVDVFTSDLANGASIQHAGSFEASASVTAIDVTAGIRVPPGTNLHKAVAYLGTDDLYRKVLAVDISNASQPVQLASVLYPSIGPTRGVAYHHGRVYAVLDDPIASNFVVLDVGSGGTTLTVAGTLNLGAQATGVTVYGGKALVSTRTPAQALTVVDTANPAHPVASASTPATAAALGVGVRHGVAHLATTDDASPLQIVSAGMQLEPSIPDTNVRIACLGDSNSQEDKAECNGQPFATCPNGANGTCTLNHVPACVVGGALSCPPGTSPTCQSHPFLWCNKMYACLTADPLTAHPECAVEGRYWAPRPTWSTVSEAVYLSTAITNAAWVSDGPRQLAHALADEAKVIVIALGSADVLGGACPPPGGWAAPYDDVEPIVTQLQTLADTAAAGGAQAFFTLPPRLRGTCIDAGCGGIAQCTEAGAELRFARMMLLLHNRIRHELASERVIDFHSGIVRGIGGGDYADWGHFTDSGQTKRLRAALGKLID